ncbi:MAG TPA: hypothetical protein VMB85_17270 [Bryobacteraceae bacterium]|jgi:hypothetical protein|nr:hypothetical protein [Bryobacteraceae bacterium]
MKNLHSQQAVSAAEEYSAAIQSLRGLEGKRLKDVLLQAHNAHRKLLIASGFPTREISPDSNRFRLTISR